MKYLLFPCTYKLDFLHLALFFQGPTDFTKFNDAGSMLHHEAALSFDVSEFTDFFAPGENNLPYMNANQLHDIGVSTQLESWRRLSTVYFLLFTFFKIL